MARSRRLTTFHIIKGAEIDGRSTMVDRSGPILIGLLAVALAGCLAGPATEGTPTSRAGLAVQPGVDDPARFTVEVRRATADGAPIEGATVVFFNASLSKSWQGFSGEEVERAYGDGRYFPCDEAWRLEESEHWNVLAVGETGPDGTVVGYLDPEADGRMLSVAVGGVDGWTTEVDVGTFQISGPGCEQDDDDGWPLNDDRHKTMTLYRRQLNASLTGTFPTTVTAAQLPGDGTPVDRWTTPAWQPHDLRFRDDKEANIDYLGRLTRLDLLLSWNNTGVEYGDLYLRAEEARGPDDRQMPDGGTSREQWSTDDPGWTVGPASDRPVLGGEDGLAYRLGVEARFAAAPLKLPSPS